MPSPKKQFVFPDASFSYSRRAHFWHLFVLTFSVVVISTAAIFYSLGYQVNLRAMTIQQTGLLSLDSKLNRKGVTVSVDGATVSSELPYRSGPMFPGIYEVTVSESGKQSWSRIVEVQANKVASYKNILLLREGLSERTATYAEQQALRDAHPDTAGLEVKENELWVKGDFITRTSADILWVQWFVDNSHLVYQAGNQILFSEPDGLQTQLLITLENTNPVSLCFTQGGRTVVLGLPTRTVAIDL